MVTVHPQYIKDTKGEKSLVVLTTKEFDAIMEELEDMDDVRLYDEAKKNDTHERMPIEEAFKIIEAERRNK